MTEESPKVFAAVMNYPNPFNPSTIITFTLRAPGTVRLAVFDITGRKVAELANGRYHAGTHSVIWNAQGCASGVYFCTLRQGTTTISRRMLLLK